MVATGNLEIVRVEVAEGAMDDREMLEDLLVAATNDALRAAQQVLSGQMSQMMGGLPLPPGLL